MATISSRLEGLSKPLAQAGVPVMVLLILVMMLVPLPALLLDLLFTLNIGMAIMVLIAALNVKNFKDFVSFPTLLLITTLMRLSLNVASTRIVLLNGHSGTDAAGKVIESFGQFLIGGNFTVGVVIFILITIINFVVITKGSGRVAEVSARFALDSMPGKQMAIDADLNAGNKIGGASVKLKWNVAGGTLTSVSAWRFWDWKPENDRDFTGLSIVALSQNTSQQNQYPQELRDAYSGDAIDFVAGAFAFDQRIDTQGTLQTTGNAGGVFNLVADSGSKDFAALVREMGEGLAH